MGKDILRFEVHRLRAKIGELTVDNELTPRRLVALTNNSLYNKGGRDDE